MTVDTLTLTAEGRPAARREGGLRPTSFRGLPAAIDARDPELHAYLYVCDESPRRGRPDRAQGRDRHEGHPDDGRLEDPRGLRAGLRRDRVERCKARGLRILGKTNIDEFAMGSSTENSAYGPSHNPWDPTRVPGGSGGGSAAAVAAGSRRGRSARTPAARSSSRRRSAGSSGCARPTARCRATAIVAFASSLDQVGPVGEDRARLRAAVLGSSRAVTRSTRRPSTCPRSSAARREDLKGVRDRRPKRDERGRGDRARRARRRVDAAIELARELGAEVGECSLPLSVEYGLACYYLDRARPRRRRTSRATTASATASACRTTTSSRWSMRTRDEGFGDELKRRIMLGTYALSAGYYDAYYGQAQKVRTLIRRTSPTRSSASTSWSRRRRRRSRSSSARRRRTRSRCT